MNAWIEKNLPWLWPAVQQFESDLQLSTLRTAFGIPSDFDDSYAAIALGAALWTLSRDGIDSAPYDMWCNASAGAGSAQAPALMAAHLKRFAYRPFATGDQALDLTSIDPRTYFWYASDATHTGSAEHWSVT